MTVIEPLIKNGKALRNINYVNQLLHNDDECRHQIVILVHVVNDDAPCFLVENFIRMVVVTAEVGKSQLSSFSLSVWN